jgi:hypothetical protein
MTGESTQYERPKCKADMTDQVNKQCALTVDIPMLDALPFGNRGRSVAGAFSSLYLFGTAQMRLGSTQMARALALKPATVDAIDPSVTLVPLPNTRDEYRLGFGVDLVKPVSALTGGSAKKPAAAVNPPRAKTSPRQPTTPKNP